ncbi:MAG: carboxypeptidase-like regulatory domain-containing protein, partial [Myxococcota bacterium]
PAPANNCVLAAPRGQTVGGSYTDPSNAADTSTDSALIDPESRVFDATTGGPVTAAQVTLIDNATGLPATTIRGDDGTSTFPATVPSGGTVTDGGGTAYTFGPGGFRFPVVPAGTYHLQVTPPGTYVFPSVVPDATLQTLPGAPFTLSVGSRGVAFTVTAGPTFALDVPLDTGAGGASFISIQPSRDVVSIGDHLQFDVRVANPGAGGAPGGMTVTIGSPVGFRYTKGSTRIDDRVQPDPTLSPDGRTLTWTLPVSALPQATHIRFTAAVVTGAAIGPNRTKATGAEIGGTRTASAIATVRVDQELLGTKSFILGRVSKGKCSDDDFGGEAIAGARIYLEDGTYSVTDSNGFYHFEGVRPGTHVVQLDVASLPGWLEPLPCPGQEGHLFAGRPFSQFADLQGGTLWRNDFRVQPRPQRQGALNQRLESQRADDLIHYQLALNGNGVAVRNARAVVMLPDGVEYVPGSTKNRGEPYADPQVDGNALTYHLGAETPDDWSMELTLDARTGAAPAAKLETKSVVLFETPNESAGKTPIALNLLDGESSAGSGMQVSETLGLRPGETWAAPDMIPPEPPKPAVYNKEWLEHATPGFEWLSPEEGFAPPIASVHIAIKHSPAAVVELWQNDQPVSKFNFEGSFKNGDGTVALSRWRGVGLADGDNRFVAKELDPDGHVIASIERLIHYSGPPFKAELAPDQCVLTADGRTTPIVAVRFTDKDGKPVREGATGNYEIDPPYEPKLDPSVRELRRQAGLAPEAPSYRIGPGGIAKIQLSPTTVSGKMTLRFMLAGQHKKELNPWLEAEARDWVLVGLTGGTLAHADVSQHMEGLAEGQPSDGFSLDRGTSFFAKGRVLGEYLLTAGYDSQREQSESDALFRKALDGGIDPNQYYTLYGDSSQQHTETPSQRPLYLKLERKQFVALFGDYTTGLTTTELSRYNRSLNGLHSEYEGDHFSFSGFGTDTNQAFVRDEIRGNGTSGLYQLSRRSIVVNSEKVRLDTRDRFQSQDVLSSQPQSRYIDYNIDYQAGTIFFKQPIPSHGDGFDPLFIVVEYEADDSNDQKISGGGRGAVKLLDNSVELGSTVLHEGTVGRNSDLYGGDLRVDLDDATRFRGEYAATHSSLLDPNASGNGGAWLAELSRRDAGLDTRAYYREQQAGFGIGQQSASETATRKMGVDARYQLSDDWRLTGQAFRESDLSSSATRDLFETRAENHEGPFASYGGFRWAQDHLSDGNEAAAPQLLGGASWTTFGNRLKLRGDTEVTVGGSGDSLEFPTRFLVGADYQLLPDLTLFAEEELALANARDTTSTRIGLRTSPWQGGQVSASIGQRAEQDAQRLFTTIGALQTFQLTDAWSFDVGVDNSVTLKGQNVPAGEISPFADKQPVANGLTGDPSGDDFTSVSLGTTYAQDLWAANLRVETRQGSSADKWGVTGGAYRQLGDGVGVALRAEFFNMNGSPQPLGATPTYSSSFDSSTGSTGSGSSALSSLYGMQSLGRLRFSAVYRPVGSRYILLDSTEFLREQLNGDVFGSLSNRIVNNANLNVKLDRATQISFQYGAKYLLESIDKDNLHGYTDVAGVELRRDIWGGFDIGGRVGMRHSWSEGTTDKLLSASLGYIVAKNLWVTAGYNFSGYKDSDFSQKDWTSQGPFISFKYKFDQQTVKDLLEWKE